MLEQKSNLRVAHLEHGRRQMLLVRTLIVYAEAFQPGTDAGRMPAVAVAGNDELVPVAAARMPSYGAAESNRAFGDHLTVGFRCGGVAQRLVPEVAAVADQVTQQRYLRVRPHHRVDDRRKSPSHGHSSTRTNLSDALPSISGKHLMVGGRAQRPAAGKRHAKNLPHSLGPNQIALRLDDFLIGTHGPHFGRLPDELTNGHAPAIGETYQRLARDAFAKIRHHRLLLHPLLDAAVELRQGDDRHL